jgi:hypothetical protein
MSNGNGNHKAKSYYFPAPIVIKSGSKITAIAGKATLTHEGDLLIRIADSQSIELIPIDRVDTESTSTVQTVLANNPQTQLAKDTIIPFDYSLFFSTKASRATYGGDISVYDYYKREKDASYWVVIRQGEGTKHHYDLGGLFDQKSKISVALRAFTREKPFYRRDLKPHLMPSSIKQGQLIKSCLEILTKEGFLTAQKVPKGEQEVDRYTRTPKMLP